MLFVIVGATMNLGPVIHFSDTMIFAMDIANVIGLYLLIPVAHEELRAYGAERIARPP